MAANYKGGIWALAQGPQAAAVFDASGLRWLARSEDTGHDINLQKNIREYERLTSWAAITIVPGQRIDRITNRGDVDTKDIAVPLNSVMGAPITGVYKHGGILAAPVPILSSRMVKGLIDGTGPAGVTTYEDFINCRVETFAVFLDEPDSQWKYEQTTVGIYNGTSPGTAADVVPDETGLLLNRGATILYLGAGAGTAIRVISFRLTLMHAADPEFTTVLTNQALANQYTLPTGFEEGAVGATLDMLLYAKEDSGGMYQQFQNNTTERFRVKGVNGTQSLEFDMPLAGYTVGQIMKGANRRPPRQRVTAVGLYKPSDLTGLIATLDNT